MNIFEDLIDELKEENLLEESFVKTNADEKKPVASQENVREADTVPADDTNENKEIYTDVAQLLPVFNSTWDKESKIISRKNLPGEATNKTDFEINKPKSDIKVESNQKSSDEAEFFSKRAVDEVSFLRMVEHVFAGIEREQMKIVPKPFDDLEVKKFLHKFLQVSKESNIDEQAQAEFQLLQETENWYSALTHRDKRISTNHLRRYCETTRPPLSSPALVALARFYRNSPYSEPARGKFDFIVTRLFSKDKANEHRSMVFDREELVTHLNELYAEWSSVPLYSTDNDNSDILLLALKFEDFITEAAVAGNFDELIKNDFFNRLRVFKKETNENFFAPLIVAASIESNIRIGNRYVELLDKEKSNKSSFEDKYGFLHDQTISDATGKTFQLVELLSRETEKPKPVVAPKNIKKEIKTEKKTETRTVKEKAKPEIFSPQKEEKKQDRYFNVSSWLLTAIIFTIIASIGIIIWSNSNTSKSKETTATAGGKIVNLENSSLKENITTARITGDTFSAVVLPTWNNLTAGSKEGLLKKIISIGNDKGFKNVQLLNDNGKIVGSASPGKIEVHNP